jgi:hypothetical protein
LAHAGHKEHYEIFVARMGKEKAQACLKAFKLAPLEGY